MRTIIQGKIVIPSGVIDGSLIVAKNRISHIIEDENLVLIQTDQQDVEIIEADGCYVMPGLVDFHGDMLELLFILFEAGMGLYEAASYASLYPARAVGLSGRICSLEEGKEADLILVRHIPGEIPIVERAMVAGKWTFSK